MILDDFVRIQNHVNVIANRGLLVVKKFSCIGSGTIIIPNDHTPTVGMPQFLSDLHINDVARSIVVEEDCWIGAGCVLLSRCHIGRGAIVAAGSVVTKPIPPYCVVAGSPAKIIAVRFTKQQIMSHESILYPEEERLTANELDELENKYLSQYKSIGTSEIADEDLEKLNSAKETLGIKIYN